MGSGMGVEVVTFHSNHEGELIHQIQRNDVDGIVINPAAYTHASRAIPDAISAVNTPVVEVHISNIKEREPWRAVSLVSGVCSATIYGRGLIGYQHALRHLVNRVAIPYETVRYGPESDQVGDLRVGGETLAVLVHGGFWRHEWTRDIMESIAVDLIQNGVSTWNIEYRRLGDGWSLAGDTRGCASTPRPHSEAWSQSVSGDRRRSFGRWAPGDVGGRVVLDRHRPGRSPGTDSRPRATRKIADVRG